MRGLDKEGLDKGGLDKGCYGIPVVTIIGVTIYIYSLFNFGNVNEQRPIERLFTYSELTTFLENSEYPFYFIAYVGFFILSNYAIEWSETLNKIAESFSFIFTITNIIYSSIITLIFVYFFIGTISVFGISPQLSKYGEYQKSYLQTYCIVNSYGLLREMTGINGRDELIIYGSIDRENWKPYEFYHKPTKTKRMPTFVVPYQPRLDWQMWLSAASASPSFTTNDLYLNSLIHKLLQNSPSVLQFIKENPFENEPPQYIKINKLTYHFSPITELSDGSWIPEKWWNVESKRVVYINKT